MAYNNPGDPLGQPSTVGSLYFRHPSYQDRFWWREFNRLSYVGGREYYKPRRLDIDFQYPVQPARNAQGQLVDAKAAAAQTMMTKGYYSLLFRHNREQEWEFENRRKRAHYFNFVRTGVNALISHSLKKGVTRTRGNADLDLFWGGVDLKRKQDIDVFMRVGLIWAAVYGIYWACVDVEPPEAGEDSDGKPYAYWVNPLDIFDWATDDDGKILWLKKFVGGEAKRTWADPVQPVHQFQIWYPDKLETWQCNGLSGSDAKKLEDRPNPLGRVPFEPLFSPNRVDDSDFPDGEPLITDFAKGANSVFNYSSLLNEIAYKQTFSQLIVPGAFDTLEAGTNTFFSWTPAGSNAEPKYISPDPRQADVLMALIQSTLEQMRQSFGIGRGRQEGSMQKSSSAALELESEDKRSILGDICGAGEDFEKRLAMLVLSYKSVGAKPTVKDLPHIQYPHDFDLQAFQDEINEFLSLRMVGLSPEVDLKLRTDLLSRKLAGMPPDELEKMLATMENVPAPVVQLPPPPGAAGLDRQQPGGQMVDKSKPNQAAKPGQGNGSPNPGKATAP